MDAEQFRQFMDIQNRILKNISKQAPAAKPSTTAGNMNTSSSMALVQSFESFDTQKETFKNYKMRFKNYIRMKNINKTENHCATLLLNLIGLKHFQLVVAQTSPKDINELKYNEVMDILETHLAPKQNTLVTQHKFLSYFQSDKESITDYVTGLRTISMECDFYCECKK